MNIFSVLAISNLEPTFYHLNLLALWGCILSPILIPLTQNEESNYVSEMKIFPEENVNGRPRGADFSVTLMKLIESCL